MHLGTTYRLQLVDRHVADHGGEDVRRENAGEDDEKAPAVCVHRLTTMTKKSESVSRCGWSPLDQVAACCTEMGEETRRLF